MLVQLPGGAAANAEHIIYVRTHREPASPAGPEPHSVLLRLQGFEQPIPLALHPDRSAAEAALDAIRASFDAAGQADELVRLPGGALVLCREVVYGVVREEHAQGGRSFVVSLKFESDGVPLAVAAFPDPKQAFAEIDRIAAALNEVEDEFSVLPGGICARRARVQRTELAADRDASGGVALIAALRMQGEPRRLVLGRSANPDEAVATAREALSVCNERLEGEDRLIELCPGFSAKKEGIRGLRVRSQRTGAGGQNVAYAVMLLTDDFEELTIEMLADADAAERFVHGVIDRVNAATAEADDGDDW